MCERKRGRKRTQRRGKPEVIRFQPPATGVKARFAQLQEHLTVEHASSRLLYLKCLLESREGCGRVDLPDVKDVEGLQLVVETGMQRACDMSERPYGRDKIKGQKRGCIVKGIRSRYQVYH